MEFMEGAQEFKPSKDLGKRIKRPRRANKVKVNINERVEVTKTVFKNFVELVDAACLTGVSAFAIYSGISTEGWQYTLLTFAGVAIALQAFLLWVRHLNN